MCAESAKEDMEIEMTLRKEDWMIYITCEEFESRLLGDSVNCSGKVIFRN